MFKLYASTIHPVSVSRKYCIQGEKQWDFLKELTSKIADITPEQEEAEENYVPKRGRLALPLSIANVLPPHRQLNWAFKTHLILHLVENDRPALVKARLLLVRENRNSHKRPRRKSYLRVRKIHQTSFNHPPLPLKRETWYTPVHCTEVLKYM